MTTQPTMHPPGLPCPHGCTHHTVDSEEPTACGHYHSPTEWGHHEDAHNSAYWQAISQAAAANSALLNPKK